MKKIITKILLMALLVLPLSTATNALAALNVTTDPATVISSTDATLNATNGASDAIGHSFWASLATFSTASPILTPGVTFSTPDLGIITATTPFSALLSSTGITVTPNTTYYVAAWSNVGGTWYPGEVLSFTTAPTLLDITVTAENFNTHKGTDYWGATTGYLLGGTDASQVVSVSVSLYDGSDNLLVTNTSKSAAKVNNTLQGPQYSSAFIVQPGTYTTSSTWNFGVWSPESNVIPAKMVVTATDVNGDTYTAQNTSFQASEPSHPTWASLFTGTLSAEDFGVVNYDTGLGMIKGYTAGFGLADNTFAGATSVVVKLYSAGDVLLQTNTAILPKFNADITGTQFSSPFDVSGAFDYATDGYWTNVRETQFGQSVPATKVVATVTLANGKVVTATNTNLTGDPTTIYPADLVGPPTRKEECKENGWMTFNNPSFKNQGQCIKFVEQHINDGNGEAKGKITMSNPSQKIKFDVSSKENKDKGKVAYWNYDYAGGTLFYKTNTECVFVDESTNTARFMFQIPDGHPGLSGLYIIASVQDNGENGVGDTYAHTATSSLATATSLCEDGGSFTSYSITGGDIMVKK